MQITNNNISNANTTGYTREVAVLQEAGSTTDNGVSLGNGVEFEGYKSVRDELLQTRIEQETSAQSSADAQSTSLQAIEPSFTTSKTDIGTEMSALFSSISSLSTDPTSSTEQQTVLTAGQNLATAFNTASNTLTTQQAGLNSQVTQDVSEINQLTEQIAALNPQLVQLKASGQNTGTTQDQMDALVLKLSALTNVSVTQTDNGETVSTGNGTALVVGSQSYALQTATGSDGTQHVLDQTGDDITSSLTSGDLGGTIQTRDTIIPGILNQLDTLANQFATAINAAQATGYDQKGNAGGDLFSVSSTVSGSAASIKVAISDPALIASSSDGTSGSNGNLTKLSAVQTTALASGKRPATPMRALFTKWAALLQARVPNPLRLLAL
jgi:flagellar hook-associated protein 1 FlgK